MKKRILIAFTLLSLVACSSKSMVQDKENEPVNESVVDIKNDRMDFIRDTFAENGYKAPDSSQWIIDNQGPHKVSVVIKQQVSKGRPLITKLVFLETEGKRDILFLQIENKIIITK